MALKSPEEIAAAFLTTLEGKLAQSLQAMPKSFHAVLSMAVGGLGSLIYAFGEQLRKDTFASTASATATVVGGVTLVPLEEHGKRYGLQRYPGAAGAYYCDVTVANSSVTVQVGTRLASDTGFGFEVYESPSVFGTTMVLSVRAVSGGPNNDGVGADGMGWGSELTWESRPTGVTGNPTVSDVIAYGSDPETDDDFRDRVRDAEGKPTNYGDQRWYREQCRRLYPSYEYWVYRATNTPNGVAIYTTGSAADASGVASALANTAPPWDNITVTPSTVVALSVELGGLSLPSGISLTATRTTIQTRISEHLSDLRPWCVGLSFPPRKDSVTAGELLAIAAEVARESGGTIGACVLRRSGVQISEYRLGQGEYAALSGSVTWT